VLCLTFLVNMEEWKKNSALLGITFGYSKLQWHLRLETWSYSVPCKSGFEFCYRQKGCSMILLGTVYKAKFHHIDSAVLGRLNDGVVFWKCSFKETP